MKDIDAVIFDFGGVILDIDYQATVRAFEQLLGPKAQELYTQERQVLLFDRLETGQIEEAEFYQGLSQLVGLALGTAEIDRAWNAMLGGTRPERLDFVRAVGASRRIFLLSNTNAIHKRAFDQTLLAAMQGKSFDALFEQAYYSHLLGHRKPHAEAFQALIDRHKLQPERTLFIDDSAQHIKGAQAVGLRTFHLQGELLAAVPLQSLLGIRS